jgi:hypothetical protein
MSSETYDESYIGSTQRNGKHNELLEVIIEKNYDKTVLELL